MTSPTQTGTGQYGQAGPSTPNRRYNQVRFLVKQLLGWVRTCTIVQVNAVYGGGINPVGTVDVTPLIGMVDGVLTVTPHGIVHGLPYFRMQGGGNAVVCDPVVNDIGFIIMSDRDSSVVKSTKAQGAPGSRRWFNLADGIYCGGILAETPTQYWAFTSTGMSMLDLSGNTIVTSSSGILFNGTVLIDRNGNISGVTNINGSGEVTFNGHTLTAHIHTQGDDSHGDTEVPTNPPTG